MSETHHSQKPSTRLQVLGYWRRYCLYSAITVVILVSLVSVVSFGAYFFRDKWLPVAINQGLNLVLPDWQVVDLQTDIEHLSTSQLRLRRLAIELMPKNSLQSDNTTAASAERIRLNARNIALDWSEPALFSESSTLTSSKTPNFAANNLTIASLEIKSRLSPTSWQQLWLTATGRQQETISQQPTTGAPSPPTTVASTAPPRSLTRWLQQQRKQIPLANLHIPRMTWQHDWLIAKKSSPTEDNQQDQSQTENADKNEDNSPAASQWQQPWRISGSLQAEPEQVAAQLHADYLEQLFSIVLSSNKHTPLWLSASWRDHTTAQISLASSLNSGNLANSDEESVHALWWLQHHTTSTGISDLWHRHPFLKTLLDKLLSAQPEDTSPYELDTLFKHMPQSGHSHWLATLPNPLQHLARGSSTSAKNSASHTSVDIQTPEDNPCLLYTS